MKKKWPWFVGVLAALVAAGVISKGWFCGQYPDHSLCIVAPPSPSPTVEPTVTPSPTPTVEPTSTPTAPPTATPIPPTPACRGGRCPQEAIYINAKKHGGMNYDSTMRCRNREYCEKSTGIPGTVDCALGEEGTPDRRICEEYHAPGCHRWYYLEPGDGQYHQCMPGQHPTASCDHYDQWKEWRWTDPECQHEGCPQEYNPYTGYCATYSVTHEDGTTHFEPLAGFQMIPHGKTQIIACGWGITEKVCSKPLSIDQ